MNSGSIQVGIQIFMGGSQMTLTDGDVTDFIHVPNQEQSQGLAN